MTVTSVQRGGHTGELGATGELNRLISQREDWIPGCLALTQTFVVCRRRAQDCGAAPHTRGVFLNGVQIREWMRRSQGEQHPQGSGLPSGPPVWETKLLRKNVCCPKAGRKSMSIAHSSKNVHRKKLCKNLSQNVSPGGGGMVGGIILFLSL